ncbi:hypothetical protein [Bacteriophage sp.]|nr:hypothetical protein [Bacteriophage sp.]UOF80113.1 hypothetical protein [Bacteriophage sp.]
MPSPSTWLFWGVTPLVPGIAHAAPSGEPRVLHRVTGVTPPL